MAITLVDRRYLVRAAEITVTRIPVPEVEPGWVLPHRRRAALALRPCYSALALPNGLFDLVTLEGDGWMDVFTSAQIVCEIGETLRLFIVET